MVNNKKGISAIVATVLIILITVAAVTIIWAAIIPLISNQLDEGTICLDAISQLQIETKDGYTCYSVNETVGAPNNISVQVKRGSKDFELAGVQILFSAEGKTFTKTSSSALPGVNEARVLFHSVPNLNNAALLPKISKVQIAPIVTVGTGEKTCEVSSEVAVPIPLCS